MFTAVPFGPGIGEYLAWMYYGGGLELARELFAKHNVHYIPCGITPPEASGWFRKEIKRPGSQGTEDALLRPRRQGDGEARGVDPAAGPGDIFQALQLGTIDATEFSMPAMDQKLGFYQVAKFYYFRAGTSRLRSSSCSSTRRSGTLFRQHESDDRTGLRRHDSRDDREGRGRPVEGDERDARQERREDHALVAGDPAGLRESLERSGGGRTRRARISKEPTTRTRSFAPTSRSGASTVTCSSTPQLSWTGKCGASRATARGRETSSARSRQPLSPSSLRQRRERANRGQ